MNRARFWLVFFDREGKRINGTVPPDDIHRAPFEHELRKPIVALRDQNARALHVLRERRNRRGWPDEIAVRVRRAHVQLPDVVAKRGGDADIAPRFDAEELDDALGVPAMDERARDMHVVALAEFQIPTRALEPAVPGADEPELVAIVVGKVDVVGLGHPAREDDEIVVEQERHPRFEQPLARLALGEHEVRVVEPSFQRESALGGRDRLAPAAQRRLDLARGRRRVPVVEIRERTVEPVPREHLLVEQRAVRTTQDRVRFGRHDAHREPVDHGAGSTAEIVSDRCARSRPRECRAHRPP
jgi:hypothetical protein